MAELYTYKGVGTGVLNLQLWRAELGTAAGEWGGIIYTSEMIYYLPRGVVIAVT